MRVGELVIPRCVGDHPTPTCSAERADEFDYYSLTASRFCRTLLLYPQAIQIPSIHELVLDHFARRDHLPSKRQEHIWLPIPSPQLLAREASISTALLSGQVMQEAAPPLRRATLVACEVSKFSPLAMPEWPRGAYGLRL